MKDNLKNKSINEIQAILLEKRNLLRDFRFRVAKGKAKDVKTGRVLRREIAGILMEINSRIKN